MLQTVKISSKRQITIPSKIFEELQLNQGDRLVLKIQENKLVIQKALSLVEELAGSIKVPKKYKNKSIDFIIKDAKREYFKRKK